MKQKRIPERICIGCMEKKPKTELIRVVKSPDGEISLDSTGKKSGRGAYICPKKECLEKAFKARRIEKSFSCKIDAAIYEELKNGLENA
jgi:hypothetical protein